jgi:hypothetical protein
MKIRLSLIKEKLAGALIVTLVICAVLCFSVLGYLSVVEQQDLLGRRSQSWNFSMTVAEAGIEEGLQHLNANYANLAVGGWVLSGGLYVRTNTLSDGSMYILSLQYGTQPILVSQAFVNGRTFAQYGTAPFFAVIGVSPSSGLISRAVRITCYRSGLFTKAMAARRTIDLRGNNILTDSYDSEDPSKSNNGVYDPGKAGDNGDVASNDTIISSVSVGNANIYGHVATGPGGGVTVGPLGGVGTHVWQASNTGLQEGYVSQDSNFTFPDTSLPYTSGLTPTSGNVAEQVIVISSNLMSSTTYPGYVWGGVATNTVSTTTVSTYPDPPPIGLVTNITSATSSTYPNPAPATVTTNIVGTTTTTTYPNPAPATVTTNVNWASSGSLPNPIPSGIVTNTTYVKDKNNYPAPGTYVGVVTTNGAFYSYYQISGYSWPFYSYTYPKYSYTYAVITYSYPNFSYSFNTYSTNTVWQTNYYDNILSVSGNYYLPELSGKTIVLANANLVVGGNVSMSGSDVIKIKPGASLTNWVGGTSLTLAGNGVINETGLAKNFVVMAAPSVTSVALSGNGTFTGVLVAPNGNVSMNGTGNNVFDFMGSLMVNSVVMNGSFRFHYDEALGRLPASGRFLIRTWDEIAIGSQVTTPPGTL